MYVMETSKPTLDNPRTWHFTLWEMTKAEYEAMRVKETESHTFRRVSADYAHAHVRNGGVHNTGLWTDHNGRIRKAQPGI